MRLYLEARLGALLEFPYSTLGPALNPYAFTYFMQRKVMFTGRGLKHFNQHVPNLPCWHRKILFILPESKLYPGSKKWMEAPILSRPPQYYGFVGNFHNPQSESEKSWYQWDLFWFRHSRKSTKTVCTRVLCGYG